MPRNRALMQFKLRKDLHKLAGISAAVLITAVLLGMTFLFIEAGPKPSMMPEKLISKEKAMGEDLSSGLLPPEIVRLEKQIAESKSESGESEYREEIKASKARIDPLIAEMRSRIADSGLVSAPGAEKLTVEREKIRQRLDDLRSRSAVLSNGTIE